MRVKVIDKNKGVEQVKVNTKATNIGLMPKLVKTKCPEHQEQTKCQCSTSLKELSDNLVNVKQQVEYVKKAADHDLNELDVRMHRLMILDISLLTLLLISYLWVML